MEHEEYFKVQEVAARFKIDRQTIYNAIRDGKLNTTRIGTQHRITEQHIQDYLNRNNENGE